MRFFAVKQLCGTFFLAVVAFSALACEARAADARDAALIVDGVTGKVLYERNADALRYPASLTKMMTLYLLFDALEKERITLDTTIVASRHAAAQTPTKLGVPRGSAITIETAIEAIAVRSANDVAVMVAEALGGSEDAFAAMMTDAAHVLGMKDTTFKNASGLPDRGQHTTAQDMALLGRRVAYDFPQYYHYLSATRFTYAGRHYRGHNNVLEEFEGADGIKTGYIRRSGFNLVTSAVRNNTHLVGVVMGGRTAHDRDQEMMELLDEAFDRAAADRTYTAWANVPWKDDPGQKTFAFYTKPEVASMVAALTPSPKPGADRYVLAASEPEAEISEGSGLIPAALPALASDLDADADADVAVDALLLISSTNDRAGIGPYDRTVEYHGQGDVLVDAVESAGGNRQASSAISSSVWVAHIGTFPNKEIAMSQLATYQIADVAGGARRIVEQVTRNGREAYHARLGYFDELEARDVCARLDKQKISCELASVSR